MPPNQPLNVTIQTLPSALPVTLSPQLESALGSQNDIEAIQTWLSVKASRSPHTRISYQKEVHRFILFLMLELGLSGLAAVKVEHLQLYWAHLANPPEHWLINKTKSIQPTPNTRLLRGPLSARSIGYSRTVINALYQYLKDAAYLTQNPVAVSGRIFFEHEIQAEKGLEPDAWAFLWQWLIEQEQQEIIFIKQQIAARNRWMCALLYHSGLRRASIVRAKMSDFSRRNGRWTLSVIAKGNKAHTVMVGKFLLDELHHYRTSLGLSELPDPTDSTPVLGNVRKPSEHMTERNIGYLFTDLTQKCAAACPDVFLARQIESLTCHGVRHTFATHSLLAGARLEAVQKALGHQSINTTSIYAKVTEDMRREHTAQVDDYWAKINQS